MKYSPSTLGFYPSDEVALSAYVDADTLPADLKDINDADYEKFINPPDGYYQVFDEQGPRVEKIPEPDYPAIAENTRQTLLSEVSSAIAVWQTKLQIGRTLKDDEKAKLNAWLDYSDMLSALDLSSAPDIEWPDKPV